MNTHVYISVCFFWIKKVKTILSFLAPVTADATPNNASVSSQPYLAMTCAVTGQPRPTVTWTKEEGRYGSPVMQVHGPEKSIQNCIFTMFELFPCNLSSFLQVLFLVLLCSGTNNHSFVYRKSAVLCTT